MKRLIIRCLQWGFNLLYHQFAWIYDFAAWLVSAGQWNDWIRSTRELVKAGPVLDIGCGQGILLEALENSGQTVFGLDESPQMLRRSRKRNPGGNLIRAVGQSMPFTPAGFQTITATFPAPYIFETQTLAEIHRILSPDGTLLILLTAECTGHSLHERLIRLTGKLFGFGALSEAAKSHLISLLGKAGFDGSLQIREELNSRLYLVRARKHSTKSNL